MTKFISRKNPVSARSLKRRPLGAVVRHHSEWETVCFTRTRGGWRRERTDFVGMTPEVVTSVQVARECNHAFGCKDSWAKVY